MVSGELDLALLLLEEKERASKPLNRTEERSSLAKERAKVWEWGSIIFLVMQPEIVETVAFDVPLLADKNFID